MKRGVPPPQAIQEAPVLLPGLDLYYGAFHDLLTCRGAGGPIPWTAVREYADYMGIRDGEDFERFFYLVRELEQERIDVMGKKDNSDGGS